MGGARFLNLLGRRESNHNPLVEGCLIENTHPCGNGYSDACHFLGMVYEPGVARSAPEGEGPGFVPYQGGVGRPGDEAEICLPGGAHGVQLCSTEGLGGR